MRTIISLPDDQARQRTGMRRRIGISRAEGVRRAVSRDLDERAPRTGEELFGVWRARRGDGLARERRLRAEWSWVRALLDTNILVDCLCGIPAARRELAR